MGKRLFDHDPFTGITQYWHYDAATDRAVIENVQDVSGILDRNKIERNAGLNEKDHGLGKKVGTIPLTLYYKWKGEAAAKGLDPKEAGAYILAKLNSRDYCHLRTVDKI